MKQLPATVAAYKRTPEFDEHTVPLRLLNEHSTKESVWGKIVVFALVAKEVHWTVIGSRPPQAYSSPSRRWWIPPLTHYVSGSTGR